VIPTADAPTIIPSPATPAAGWSEANASAPPPAAAATGWSEAAAVIGGAAPWVEQLPFRNRTHPRSFGTGAFGVDRYDSRDNTRYAWTRIAPALASLFMFVGLCAPAHAQNAYCEPADAVTLNYGLCKPSVDVEGANPWGLKYNTDLDMLAAALVSLSTSSMANGFAVLAASSNTFQGGMYILGAAGLTVSGSAGITSTTGTFSGKLAAASGAFTSTATAAEVIATTVSATYYYGNAQYLSGVPSSAAISGFFWADDFTSLVNGTSYQFTLTYTPVNASAVFLVRNGLTLRPGIEFTLAGNVVTISTPPAAGTSSFYATYAVNTTAYNQISTIVVLGSATVYGAGGLYVASSVTAAYFVGSGQYLTGLASSGTVGALGISTNSLQVQINSIDVDTTSILTGFYNVGASTLALSNNFANYLPLTAGSGNPLTGQLTSTYSGQNPILLHSVPDGNTGPAVAFQNGSDMSYIGFAYSIPISGNAGSDDLALDSNDGIDFGVTGVTKAQLLANGNFNILQGVVAATGTITGPYLTVAGSSFSVGGSSFTVFGGSGTIAYALTVTDLANNVLGLAAPGGVQILGSTITQTAIDALNILGPIEKGYSSTLGQSPGLPINIIGSSATVQSVFSTGGICNGSGCNYAYGFPGPVNITGGAGGAGYYHTTLYTFPGAAVNISGGAPDAGSSAANPEGFVNILTSATFAHTIAVTGTSSLDNGAITTNGSGAETAASLTLTNAAGISLINKSSFTFGGSLYISSSTTGSPQVTISSINGVGFNALGVNIPGTSLTSTTTIFNGGNVGIGTTNPLSFLEVVSSGTSGLPATSGAGQTNGSLRVRSSYTGTAIDFGVDGTNTGNAWMQASSTLDHSTQRPLLINPNGGNVSIATTTTADSAGFGGTVVNVGGAIYSRQSDNSANYIVIGVTGGASYVNGAGLPMYIGTSATSIKLGTTTGTQIYRCSGGTDAGWILYGNSGAAQTLCTGGGGSLVGTGTYLP
jgi:hypothetical protein